MSSTPPVRGPRPGLALSGLGVVAVAGTLLAVGAPLVGVLSGMPVVGPLLAASWLGYDALFLLLGVLAARTGVPAADYGALVRWWGRGLLRLYPLYAVAVAALFAVAVWVRDAPVDAWAVLRAVLLLSAVESSFADPLWAVSVLWLGVLLLPALMVGLHAAREWSAASAAAALVLVVLVSVLLVRSPGGPPVIGVGAYVRGLGELALGAVAWTLLSGLLANASPGRRVRLGNALVLIGGAVLVVGVVVGIAPGSLLIALAAIVVGCAYATHNLAVVLARLAPAGPAAYAAFCAGAVTMLIAVDLFGGTDAVVLAGAALLAGLLAAAALGAVLWRFVDTPLQSRLEVSLLR